MGAPVRAEHTIFPEIAFPQEPLWLAAIPNILCMKSKKTRRKPVPRRRQKTTPAAGEMASSVRRKLLEIQHERNLPFAVTNQVSLFGYSV
jgi:hypothetical protein